MSDNNSHKSPIRWLILIFVVIAVPITLMILYGLGQTSGVEFSPDDFSRRGFSYNQSPYFNWVLGKKVYSDKTTPLEESLILDGFIPPVINTTKTWHLIQDSGSSLAFASDQCDARFLTNYLDLSNDEGDDYWTIWNTNHPKSAKVYWPRIAELARDQMYLKIPDIMQFAMELKKDEVRKFTDSLDRLLADAYLELGELDLELDQLERAQTRLGKSIDFFPTSKATDLLARCQSKLGSQPVHTENEKSNE